jgi:hypothetical protein
MRETMKGRGREGRCNVKAPCHLRALSSDETLTVTSHMTRAWSLSVRNEKYSVRSLGPMLHTVLGNIFGIISLASVQGLASDKTSISQFTWTFPFGNMPVLSSELEPSMFYLETERGCHSGNTWKKTVHLDLKLKAEDLYVNSSKHNNNAMQTRSGPNLGSFYTPMINGN